MVLMRGLILVIKIILLYHVGFTNIWDKGFKNGPSKICGGCPFKIFEGVWSALSRPYHFKYFKGCPPQILLGPCLNTLSQMQRKLIEMQFL